MPDLDLDRPVTELVADLVDIASVSGTERRIADAVEAALRTRGHLQVQRHGNTVVAWTESGRDERVVVAGHLDTVPINGNFPSSRSGGVLHGIGSCDMKGGVAVALRLAAQLSAPNREVTYVFYDCEEIEAERNGLGRLAAAEPARLRADFAVVMEPTNAMVEGGCQGTMRVDVRLSGERAHSARSWTGHNAIHDAGQVLTRLAGYRPRRPVVDGLRFHEGMNAVGITGGVAGNVIPDSCVISVNYRFAPDRDVEQAYAHVREVLAGFEVTLVDSAPGARPGLDRPAAAAFVAATAGEPRPKFGWTDVARFAGMGVPAVNYGPGDPLLAHKADEHVNLDQVTECEQRMLAWLGVGRVAAAGSADVS